jgi:hypothetical protein
MYHNNMINIKNYLLGIIFILIFDIVTAASLNSENSHDYLLIVEGKTIPNKKIQFIQSTYLLPLDVIAKELGHQIKYDAINGFIAVRRKQDKAVLVLRLKDGRVTANKHIAGYVPEIKTAIPEQMLLPKSAVEALTGTHIQYNQQQRTFNIKLDKRLREVFDFVLYVNGEPLTIVEPPARAIGSVLLLPLRPIAEALGSKVSYDPKNREIKVLRIQDFVTISMSLNTGLTKFNGKIVGVSPDINLANSETLLLPVNAIETLTGTHIKTLAGTNEVHIDLDNRLIGILAPSAGVLEKASKEPFTLENIQFSLTNKGINQLYIRSHYKTFNSLLRYEVDNIAGNQRGLTPSWLSLDFQSIQGYRGSIGDYNANQRELNSVFVSRMRGFSFYKPLQQKNLFTFAIGQPISNIAINNNSNIPQFGGFTGGVRYYNRLNHWQIGGAFLQNEANNKQFGIDGIRYFKFLTESIGSIRLNLDGQLNAYSLNNKSIFDSRGGFSLYFRPLDNVNFNLSSNYQGIMSGLNNTDETGADNFNSSLSLSWNALDWASFGTRFGLQRTGIRSDYLSKSFTKGISTSLRPFIRGPQISADYSETKFDEINQLTRDFSNLNVQMRKAFRRWDITTTYQKTTGDSVREFASLFVNLPRYRQFFQKYSAISLRPSLSYTWLNNNENGQIGLNAQANSGRLFGTKFHVSASYYHLQTVLTDVNQSETDYLSIKSNYRLSKNLLLEANYSTSFQNNAELWFTLRGNIFVNPPRRYSLPLVNRGILEGQAFFDKNNDGKQQQNETGYPNAPIFIKNTPYALMADQNGYFTIQNLPVGHYEIGINREAMPLNQMLSEKAELSFAIGDKAVTKIKVPIVQSGQIRGQLFVDANHNGILDPKEKGVDGVRLYLEDPKTKQYIADTYTTLYGQFAFEQLKMKRYRLKIDSSFLTKSKIQPRIIFELSPTTKIMRIINIPIEHQ